MSTIQCTACNKTLRLPPGFTGSKAKCPACGVLFSVSATGSPQAPVEPSPQPPEPEPEPESQAPVAPPIPPASAPVKPEFEIESSTIRTSQPSSLRLASLLDVRFTHYLTPAIIRFTWVCVLIMSALWMLFLMIGFFASMLPSGAEPSTSASSIDLDAVMNGDGDLGSLTSLLGSSLTGGQKEQTFFQSVKSFAFKLLAFLSLLVGLVLSVLWCRVMFETIIVVFDISNSLKSIDRKTE
ncbi:MAG: DUF4282 domain-containing protein [Pirellulaceae bacterium]